MAVQVWIGEKPEHPNERRAIVSLANGLDRLDGLYLILANFSVGGRNIDLVLIKQDAIFIVELKQCDGKIFGDVNGPWFVESANGERKRLNPGRKNPYNQVISYYYSLINFLNEHRGTFLSPQKATSVDFRTCKRLVVIAPTIQEGSQVETDWKVELKGLDELPAYLITERSSEINLSEEEMLAIPALLHCTRWSEVNSLLAGVMPRWEAVDGEASTTAPLLPAPAPAETAAAPAVETQPSLWARGRGALGTWAGRAAVLMAAVALVLAVALVALATRRAPVLADQAAIGIVSTSQAAGGEGFGGVLPAESCVWNDVQAVGRRRGSQPTIWENVGVGGNTPALQPEVVVTLEEVNFCQDTIKLTWSVRNNLEDESVALPLTAENIAVSDSLQNVYTIDNDKSLPPQISVAPRSKARGTATVTRPANLNAKSLAIKLKQMPFGEATWIVPIGGAGN